MRKALLVLMLCLLSHSLAAQERVAVCAARNLDAETALWIEQMTERLRPEAGFDVVPVRIPVVFHMITSGKEGVIKAKNIATLLSRLNWAFQGTPFSFYLAGVDRTNKPSWYKDCGPGTANERAMKKRLARDPKRTLNLYSCKPYIPEIESYVLGYSAFPFENPEDSYMHGIMLHPAGLPGGTDQRFNRHGLAAHEVGHIWASSIPSRAAARATATRSRTRRPRRRPATAAPCRPTPARPRAPTTYTIS